MRARFMSLSLVALLCLPGLALAQERSARPRSGGSDRQAPARSGASERHSRPAASSERERERNREYAPPRTRGAEAAPLTGAQARHPRPGTGTGYRGYYPGYRSGYDPYYGLSRRHYPAWYGGLDLSLGFNPYGYYSYYPYYPYSSYYGYLGGVRYGYRYAPLPPVVYVSRRDEDGGAVRVQVQPSRTQVYVDGNLAGEADDFDGLLQRLYLSAGRHELSLELDGYRTHRVLVYVSPGTTLKIRHDMQEGIGAATLQDLTDGQGADEPAPPPPAERDRAYARGGTAPAPPQQDESRAGVLLLRVSPADASVYVDGRFQGAGASLLELALPAGAHRVEVVRPGYDPWVQEIRLGERERRELSVELPPR